MRQQVGLGQHHQPRGGEHVGILQRLVVALGDRQDRDLGALTQIPHRRADEVADVLDEQQCRRIGGGRVQRQPIERRRDHRRIEMAALAGVDLHGRRTGGADAIGVVAGLLVALDHCERLWWVLTPQRADRGHQQRGLARAGARHQVVGRDAMRREVGAVRTRDRVVGAQHVGLEPDGALDAHAGHRHPGLVGAEMQVRRRARRLAMVVIMAMVMHVGVRMTVDLGLGAGAAADDAHDVFS